MTGRRRRSVPEPRYAVVVSQGGASDPELLMDGIPTTGADLNVSAGVVYSNLDSAFGDITRNGLPTRAAPSDDGTWCAFATPRRERSSIHDQAGELTG